MTHLLTEILIVDRHAEAKAIKIADSRENHMKSLTPAHLASISGE